MKYKVILRTLAITVFTSTLPLLAVGNGTEAILAQSASNKCDIPFPLPNPSEIGVKKFEKLFYEFLEKGCYKAWKHDSQIRNTGPFISGIPFGTHDAVKVYYSPQIWDWLKSHDRQGDIADGAITVKEMYESPAKPDTKFIGWTAMVKDKKGSFDGWYWSFHMPNSASQASERYPDSGFGLYCLQCHASAAAQSTFITLKNVEGDPISFNVLIPTMRPPPPTQKDIHTQVATAPSNPVGSFPTPRASADPNFLNLFRGMPNISNSEVKSFPGEGLDHIISPPGGPNGFLTSSQCISCHDASNEDMTFWFVNSTRPINLSPYTEWRASLMGLAGRDPIFHAQLESEKALYPSRTEFLDNTCYRCHGVMGQRQVELDKNQLFQHRMVYAPPDDPDARYGALARDGVSCVVCHRISREGLGTLASFTGKFKLDPVNVINGPFDQPAVLSMKNAQGITPRFSEQIKKSALCGSCHTVILPVFNNKGEAVLDRKGQPKEFHEQMTYPEWLNSVYQNEREPIKRDAVRTCQDCHMPQKYGDQAPLNFRIATIEDNNSPYTDYRAPDKEITVSPRQPYSRHTLVGINQFGIMMFQQFPLILGIRTADYMYPQGTLGLETALNSSTELATKETARIEVTSLSRSADYLEAGVHVENLAGHGLPSGVAFRRAFITFEVLDATGKVIWASGRTNSVGAIVKGVGDEILPTEFFYDPATGKQVFQPHYEIITDEGQVQIYEELMADAQGKISTSFVGLNDPLKNNRLLPKGWRAEGPYAEFTRPHGDAERDPEYINASGASGADKIIYRVPLSERMRHAVSVRVTLNYQSIPPYYLKDRFMIGKGPETKRLVYFTSHLTVDGTRLANWKVPLVCASRQLGDTKSTSCPP